MLSKRDYFFELLTFGNLRWKALGAFRGSEVVLGGIRVPKCRPEASKMMPKCFKIDFRMQSKFTLGSHLHFSLQS